MGILYVLQLGLVAFMIVLVHQRLGDLTEETKRIADALERQEKK